MPNPFEEEFSKNPFTKRKMDKNAEAAAEQRQAAQDQAQLEAAAKSREQKTQEELEKYDALVRAVLSDLRDALYPELRVLGGKDTLSHVSQGDTESRLDTLLSKMFITRTVSATPEYFWQLGREIQVSDSDRQASSSHLEFVPTICIGLKTSQTGEATGFVCKYLKPGTKIERNERAHNWTRSREFEPTHEALIQALVNIHKPNPLLQEIAKRNSEAKVVLDVFIHSPVLIRVADALRLKRKEKTLADRYNGGVFKENERHKLSVKEMDVIYVSKNDPLIDKVDSLTGNDAWVIQANVGSFSFYQSDTGNIEFGEDIYDLIGVRILYDDLGKATHYECRAYYMENGQRADKGGLVQVTALDEASLKEALTVLITKLQSEPKAVSKEEKRRGRWF